jgi:hypothetical protein
MRIPPPAPLNEYPLLGLYLLTSGLSAQTYPTSPNAGPAARTVNAIIMTGVWEILRAKATINPPLFVSSTMLNLPRENKVYLFLNKI